MAAERQRGLGEPVGNHGSLGVANGLAPADRVGIDPAADGRHIGMQFARNDFPARTAGPQFGNRLKDFIRGFDRGGIHECASQEVKHEVYK